MGFVVFLLIVVGIIVIVVVNKKNKFKKATEELKNSNVYELAVKIKDELEKNEGNFRGPVILDTDGVPCGWFYNEYDASGKCPIEIYFSEYERGLYTPKQSFRLQQYEHKYRLYGIENEKIGIIVTSRENNKNVHISQDDILRPIKIAAEIIEKNGYGPCTEI